MNIDNYLNHMILRVIVGSHAYGMATEQSDLDVKGILIPPKEFLLGVHNFEQTEGKIEKDPLERIGLDFKLLRNGGEFTYYSLRKYFKLARDCNPSILEILFADPKHFIWDGISPENRKLGELLIENRRLFLSQKVKWTYVGYSHAQLKRIKGHNKWLMNPQPEDPPRAVDFMMFYQLSAHPQNVAWRNSAKIILKDDPEFTKWVMCKGLQNMGAKPIPGTDNKAFFLFLRGRGVVDHSGALLSDYSYNYDPDSPIIGILVFQKDEYRRQMKKWKEYWNWVKNRNKVRSELERKYGYDTKHANFYIRYTLKSRLDEVLACLNSVNSVEALTGNAEGDTEPSLDRKVSEGVTTTAEAKSPKKREICQ